MYHQFKELADVDITKEPMEVGPTCHYVMGGVEVDPDTAAAARVPGLFAAGEVAGGMHGSNRLGGNSLSDLLVFGRRAGVGAAEYVASLLGKTRPEATRAAIDAAEHTAVGPFDPPDEDSTENPYTLHQELQQVMNDLVGIIRKAEEVQLALAKLATLKQRLRNVAVEGHRQFNPGWHLALDLRNMVLVSECVARAALLRRGVARRAHPRRLPRYGSQLASAESRLCGQRRRHRGHRTADPADAARPARAVRPRRAGQVPHRRRATRAVRQGDVMTYQAKFRIWRGDADGGELVDYTVEVNEGEVVLDIIHRLQATQAGDLAVRWNCKAGKCGSCSAEVNGRPRLLCMTRMSIFTEAEPITVTPLRTFPVMKDLVTDVSFNYRKAEEIPAFAPPAGLKPGEYRMQQVDVERSQEFRKCIECFLCQDVCHVIRDHEDNKEAFAGPRFLIRAAELDMHPLDTHRPRRVGQDRPGHRDVQHHQVLHRGLPRAHQDHRQRDHPHEGARRRPQVRPAGLARQQDRPPVPRSAQNAPNASSQ